MRRTSYIVDTFKAIQQVLYKVMDKLGEPREMYVVCIHPFSLYRLDGQPVPKKLIQEIESKFLLDIN
jgi:hypothetical protein